METALTYLQSQVDYRVVWLLLYDRASHSIVGQGGRSPELGKQNFLRERLVLKSGSLLEQIVLQQRVLIIPNLCEEPKAGPLMQIAQAAGIQGGLLFPIHHHDIFYGLVLLGSERWGILARSEEKALLSILLGQLATSFHDLEQNQQQEGQKRPDKPLLEVIQALPLRTTLQERIDLVLETAHGFLEPTQMGLYWYEPEGRYFWGRAFSSKSRTSRKRASDPKDDRLTVQTYPKFYQALTSNPLMTVGTAQSSLPADATQALLGQFQGRSLLATPLSSPGQLLGFLVAVSGDARIWTEDEKQFLLGSAQLLALVSPLDTIEQEIAVHRQSQGLIAEVSHAVRSDQDWNHMLTTVAPQILEYFQVERLVLMVYDDEVENFAVAFQHQTGKRKGLPDYWPGLSDIDKRLLDTAHQGIALDSIQDDLRLLGWRDLLLTGEIQSLMVSRTTVALPLEGVLVLGHETPRTWSIAELNLLRALAQHLGQAMHQWVLQQDLDQQNRLYQTLQWGLTTMQQMTEVEALDQAVTQFLGQTLQAPLATLVTWKPRRPTGKLTAIACTNPAFQLQETLQIPVTDVLIQQVLGYDGVLQLSIDQLTADTCQWLSAPLDRLVAVALRTSPEDEPLGILIVADAAGSYWSAGSLSVVGALANQWAWSRRDLTLIQRLNNSQSRLRQLNWYKHYRFIELRRLMETAQGHLNQGLQASQTATPAATSAAISQRYQQANSTLGQALSEVLQIIRHEQWQLQFYNRQVPLASFLKRALSRIDPLVKQRRLWVQIHTDETLLALAGDVIKLESVLYQVLVFACHRSPEQGRIDLWCRLLDQTTLDLSVTDGGSLEPYLLQELQEGRHGDALAPSTLDQPPGLLLAVCQSLLGDMGGQLEFYSLEDGRTMSRLVLPFVESKGS